MAKKKTRPPRGPKLTVEDILPAIMRGIELEKGLGTGEAFNIISGARAGHPELGQKVAELTQPGLSMHELTGTQRYLQGKELGQSMGFPLATLANAVYTGDKALSQALGRSERFIPIDDTRLDETTSEASLANLLAAQAGITSQSPLLQALAGALGKQSGGPIPNQTSGTKMPKAKIRIPAMDLIQQFQSGGIVGDLINMLRNLNVDTSQISNFAGQLGGIGGQLAGFDPYGGRGGGAAAGTLEQMLQTGAPTDVSPITEASTMQAQQLFGDLMGRTNEQFGALGLGSSSARQRALARGASDIATGVGAEGLRAGVGAQEAARGRQMGAFSPFFQGAGQQLTGLTGAGQSFLGAGNLAGQAAGLGLQGQLGQTGGMQNLTGLLTPIQAGQMNQPPAPNPMQAPVGGYSPQDPGRMLSRTTGRGGVGGVAGGGVPQNIVRKPFQGGGQVGGRRDEYGDYLSNLLFGREFQRRAPVQMQRPEPTRQVTQSQMPSGLGNMLQGLLSQSQAPIKRAGLTGGKFEDAFLPHQERYPGLLGPAVSRQPYLGLAGPLGSAKLADYLMATAMQNLGRQEGGMIDGPSVPPDQVPILAQGGEGVIPIKLMDKIEKSPSTDPIVRELKKLMGFKDGGKVGKVMGEFKRGTLRSGSEKGPKVSDRKQAVAIGLSEARKAGEKVPPKKACGGKVKFQAGGQVPTITDPTQAVQQGGLQQGGAGTFSQMGAMPDPGADLELKRSQMERLLQTLHSAIATAANPERATALLTPRIAQTQAEVDRIAGEQDALRARQMEELRAQTQLQGVQEQVAGQKDIAEMQVGQRQEEAEMMQEQVLAERQQADREAFGQLVESLIEEPDATTGMGGRSPEDAMVMATQVGPGMGIPVIPEAEQFVQQYYQNMAPEALDAKLKGLSVQDLDENMMTALMSVAEKIDASQMSLEEVETLYPELVRITGELLMQGGVQ